jgi:hypothetical protein
MRAEGATGAIGAAVVTGGTTGLPAVAPSGAEAGGGDVLGTGVGAGGGTACLALTFFDVDAGDRYTCVIQITAAHSTIARTMPSAR